MSTDERQAVRPADDDGTTAIEGPVADQAALHATQADPDTTSPRRVT